MFETAQKINTLEELKKRCEAWKNANESIVFTNGCFDILHLGHIDYLEKARNMGKKLIVGLNTDESIRKLKGQFRPINNLESRSRILAALEFVSAVITFDQDTPLHLITILKPNILVKGDDYSIKNIVGAKEVVQSGGQVITIPLISGFSTSEIIKKCRFNN